MATRIGLARRRTASSSSAGSSSSPRLAACCTGFEAERGQDRLAQVAHAFAVLGRDGDRLAEPQLEGLVEAVGAGPPLALVGDQDGRHARAAHHARERRIGRHHAVARIEHEQHQVGAARSPPRSARACARRSMPGAASSRPAVSTSVTLWPAHVGLALAPVARQPRHVRDQRGVLAGQPVEERRFADVGSADDGDGWGMGARWRVARSARALARNGRAFN